jgi:hypothetical protein
MLNCTLRRSAICAALAVCSVNGQQIDYVHQIRNKPAYDSTEYAWFRTNGAGASADLSATGAKTITLTSSPRGVAGANANYYVRIYDGTGTAEVAQVTGGTCTSGAASSCTLTLTTAQTHTGAWKIGPVAAGINEAANVASAAGGGVVRVPAGTHLLYGAARIPSNVKLRGDGRGIGILRVANGAASISSQWLLPDHPGVCGVVILSNSSKAGVEHLTVDINGSNQSGIAFSAFLTGESSSNLIQDVESINPISQPAALFGVLGDPVSNFNNTIKDSWAFGTGGAISTCPGGFFLQGKQNKVVGSYGLDLCDDGFIANGSNAENITFEGNTVDSLLAGFHAELASRVRIINNVVLPGSVFGIAVDAPTAGYPTPTTVSDVEIIGNTVEGATTAGITVNRAIDATSAIVRSVHIQGNRLRANALGIQIVDNTSGFSFIGNTVESNTGSGIHILSALFNVHPVTYGLISGNVIRNNGTTGATTDAGILLESVGGGSTSGISMRSNQIIDDRSGGSRTQDYGVRFLGTGHMHPTIENNVIAGNITSAISASVALNFAGLTVRSNISDDTTMHFRDVQLSPLAYGVNGVAIASAPTITPTHTLVNVSGTATISTMNIPYPEFAGCIVLIPGGAWSTDTAGNFNAASTAIVGKPMQACYLDTKWFTSY